MPPRTSGRFTSASAGADEMAISARCLGDTARTGRFTRGRLAAAVIQAVTALVAYDEALAAELERQAAAVQAAGRLADAGTSASTSTSTTPTT